MPTAALEITIRELVSLTDYEACVALQRDTWGQEFAESVPAAILSVSQKIGGVTAGAFDDAGRLVGFVFGMTGLQHGELVHWSDMLAVRAETRGIGLGEKLKEYQRAHVLALGVKVMRWTADPLVARNAHFNINHLGAFPTEYIENMYGENTGSVLHGVMPTDRVIYRWQLDAPTATIRTGRPSRGDESLPNAIVCEPDGTPLAVPTLDAAQVRIHVPHDLTVVQADNGDRALAWRVAVRAAFTSRFAERYTVTRFVRAHDDALPYYVLSVAY
jgi:predicted GNAT superfamily acetyltransferase